MRTSCISHPKNEPLIVIHRWQYVACKGNTCAAALLSFFEYWHNIRVEQSIKSCQSNAIAETHNEQGTQDESLWQFHNSKELEDAMFGIGRRESITQAITVLIDLNFIKVSGNPNPRYKFDRTRYFQFLPDAVNDWIKANIPDDRKIDNASTENRSRQSENSSRQSENRFSSNGTEITTEITTENIRTIRQALNQHFVRQENAPWGNDEEHFLVEVAKRPDCISELKAILDYSGRCNGFFPQSVGKLLYNWTDTLDKSRCKIQAQRPPTINELRTQFESFSRAIDACPGNPEHRRYDPRNKTAFEEYKSLLKSRDETDFKIRTYGTTPITNSKSDARINGQTTPALARV